ncbi:PUB domain-containing protein [Sporobolomyces salmoneus]|uniref:PUB domain-containing protein n=1 Tax=Sporobolomyces salmoneus TaxID=183962 RepID=UPI0031747DD7
MAALTRGMGGLSLSQDGDQPMYWERKHWQRLIDDELIAKSHKKQAIETLETIIKLVEGVQRLPSRESDGNERERTIRLRNGIVKRTIVDVPGAYDLLVQCGFKRTIVDFEERLTFPRPPIRTTESRLTTSLLILTSSLAHLRRRSELEESSKQAAKYDNERRMKVVLEEIKYDRQKHKEREARRKAAKLKGSGEGAWLNSVPETRDWL